MRARLAGLVSLPLSTIAPSTPLSPGDLSVREPPDPIPNSTVKPRRADDRVSITHAKVGHRQALFPQTP